MALNSRAVTSCREANKVWMLAIDAESDLRRELDGLRQEARAVLTLI